MKTYLARLGFLAAAAVLTLPLEASAKSFKEIVNDTIVPLGDTLVTLLYGFAFVFFLFGVVRYVFAGGEETRQKGKQHIMWGIIGLAVLFMVWGFVRILLNLLTEWSV